MADLSIWMIALLGLTVASPATACPPSVSASALASASAFTSDSASASAVPDSEAAEGLLVEAMAAATSGRAQEVLGWIRKGIDPSYEGRSGGGGSGFFTTRRRICKVGK